MAYEIGSAAGHYDLLTKIRTFVEVTIPLAERYTVMREVPTGTDREIIWKASGLSGTEEIYFGIKTYQSISSDYYNFKLGVFTGYVSGNSFEAQPGNLTEIGLPLWNQNIPYLLVANGQRLIISTKVETVYNSAYLGKFLPYATPTQYPYPVICGGCLAGATNTRYSDISYQNWFKGVTGRLLMRKIDGSWISPQVGEFYNHSIYDTSGFDTSSTKHQLRNIASSSLTSDGWYGLIPLTLSISDIQSGIYMTDTNADVFGELDGVFYISGFNNSAENLLIHNGITYYITRDAWRTGFNDYLAIRLS